MKIIPKESEIQAMVCDYLALKKHFFWRSNNLPVFDSTRKVFRRMPLHAKKGVPDVILVRNGGLVCFLEIKRPGGKLSVEQEMFQNECERLKAEYHIITDLNQVIELGL